MPRFSVVIPTRNRAHTLRQAIPTVLAQTDPDFELVIQDNASPADTKDIVAGFDDPRIVYSRSDTPLSLHENWEQALRATSGDFIIVIGDDDALLPDSLARARTILDETGLPCLAWSPVIYLWPCYGTECQRNLLTVPLGLDRRIVACRPRLEDLYTWRQPFGIGPGVYHGLAHRSVIDSVRKRTGGRYFIDFQPDIGSVLSNLYVCDHYIESAEPLSIGGWSGVSNAGRPQTAEGMRIMTKRFADEAGQPSSLWGFGSDERLLSPGTAIARSQAVVREALFPECPDLRIDERAMFANVIGTPSSIAVPFPVWQEAASEHAARLGIAFDPAMIREPSPPIRDLQPGYDGSGRLNTLRLDGETIGFRTLADAVTATAAILAAYRTNPFAVRSRTSP